MNTENFYITCKGYKIPLDSDIQLINTLKKELMVQPYCENPVKFPIFRISNKYLYIPKYYGINKFGLPSNIKEQEGLCVNINFITELKKNNYKYKIYQ